LKTQNVIVGNFVNSKTRSLSISTPELFIDNEARGRSGHMSHALVEYAPQCILAFNSNCSSKRASGHSPFGWIECHRSTDGGITWDPAFDLPFAKQAFIDGLFTVSIEKAIACDDGSIVAFCLRNTPYRELCCEPWLTPMYIRSFDGGKTWTEAKELSPYKGRIYDARYYNGRIYALEFCNDAEENFTGSKPDHVYRIFTSDDNGSTFSELGIVPINGIGRGYGAMIFRPDGSLIVYAYNLNDEFKMDYVASPDKGVNWAPAGTCFVNRGIRNPQVAILDGIFILHGRGAMSAPAFILYTSIDGTSWGEGSLLRPEKPASLCYYSNNIVLGNGRESRLLIQYSETYRDYCVNVMHMWIKPEIPRF